MISVLVFTRDLRVADNPALSAAVAGSSAIVPLFVLDDDVLAGRFGGHAGRLGFLLESLADLDANLRALGGALVVRRGPWVQTVIRVALQARAGTIHLAGDISGYANARLTRLRQAAASVGLTVLDHPGITVVPPGALSPPGRAAYQVFTPYYRRWLGAPRRPILSAARRVTLPGGIAAGRVPELRELTGTTPALSRLRGGECAAWRRLRQWARDVAWYPAARNDLGADQTSRLSAYLHMGCLSPVGMEAELQGLPGGDTVIRQLAWRDFFCQLLAAHPRAAAADFRKRTDDHWSDDPDALAAWQAGQTGYPVVDAGMRQLAAEGFMHGRARMITASFLTKDLYLDWRPGAAHFLRHLVDGDLACNQLNWQWVAGTGTDTRPARMLSPVLQSRRHDPAGDYIRRWVPELAHLPAGEIHEPSREKRRGAGYPEPIVDHHEAAAAFRARQRLVVAAAP